MMPNLLNRLEAVAERLERVLGVQPDIDEVPATSASEVVIKYDALIHDFLNPWIDASQSIGSEVAAQAEAAKKAFTAQREMMVLVSKCKKPSSQHVLEQIVEATAGALKQVAEIKDKSRSSKYWNHLQTVAEGIQALGWVYVERSPASFIAEMAQAAELFSNKIVLEYKMTDQLQVQWVKLFKELLKQLQAYVQAFHTQHLTWNPQGIDAQDYLAGEGRLPSTYTASKPKGGPGAPPPPPPPPAAPLPSASDAPSPQALFAEINQGNLTSGLRHVSKDQKSKGGKAPIVLNTPGYKAASTPPPVVAPPAAAEVKTPVIPEKFVQDGNKWFVEGQVGKQLSIDTATRQQSIYIRGCKDTVVTISGKVNQITVDLCVSTGIAFDDVVSAVELVNCKKVKVQCNGKMPTFAVDKSDETMVYLSKSSLDVEILTSKVAEMNVLLPTADPDDWLELAVPQQFKTTIADGKRLVTEA
eukprot:CAMPEP_0196655008 /NCGR_PEP_ID=MMETSP1086-20130531/4758_1 /TAXON_ID=77921 /ORGANISM="Cyanoptyche  gloeocystis , Strain SAG4.97" /LENGTH=470 /DNA_ID=CAMNT_0041987091 /DNA_START=56 /DNA_END=1465 /DNA_ORIENTATION=+